MARKELFHHGIRYTVSYSLKNLEGSKNLVFLHGWGSNKEIMMQAFDRAFKGFRHIYIDLPGFGGSSNEKVLRSEDYAEIIKHFLGETNLVCDIAVGHSFGGKVATLLDPGALVLLSSSGILLPKPWKVRFKIRFFKLLKALGIGRLSTMFRADDAKHLSEAMYATFKLAVNEDFSEQFARFDKPALLLWGSEDTATPPEAGRKIHALMPQSRFALLPGDHYFFLNDQAKSIQQMEAFLEDLSL